MLWKSDIPSYWKKRNHAPIQCSKVHWWQEWPDQWLCIKSQGRQTLWDSLVSNVWKPNSAPTFYFHVVRWSQRIPFSEQNKIEIPPSKKQLVGQLTKSWKKTKRTKQQRAIPRPPWMRKISLLLCIQASGKRRMTRERERIFIVTLTQS